MMNLPIQGRRQPRRDTNVDATRFEEQGSTSGT